VIHDVRADDVRVDAWRWFADRLTEDADAGAYLAERGIDAALAGRLGIGYAPRSWVGLTDHLADRGYSGADVLDAGLGLRTARRTVVDRFRARIMLPVKDEAGRLVAFTGRTAPAAAPDVPKYLDTPTSSGYRKGEHWHGLADGRRLLAAGAVPVIVEGPFDAVAVTLTGAGRYVGLAPGGTALTVEQVAALDRVAGLDGRRLIVAYDADSAGHEAALAAWPLLHAAGAKVDAAALPEGVDPAELVRERGRPALLTALHATRPLEDRVVDEQLARWAAQRQWAEGTVGAMRSAARVTATLRPERAGRQVARIAASLDVPAAEVTSAVVDALDAEPALAGAPSPAAYWTAAPCEPLRAATEAAGGRSHAL